MLAADVHLNRLKPEPLLRSASRLQLPLVRPISLSILPTSRPQAYPALKLIAEKTRTTPADIIHEARVGLMSSSPAIAALAGRNFLACRSLLDSRDFRLVCLGDDVRLDLGRVGFSSSDSGTKRKAVA